MNHLKRFGVGMFVVGAGGIGGRIARLFPAVCQWTMIVLGITIVVYWLGYLGMTLYSDFTD